MTIKHRRANDDGTTGAHCLVLGATVLLCLIFVLFEAVIVLRLLQAMAIDAATTVVLVATF
jgi:hypothetical protein